MSRKKTLWFGTTEHREWVMCPDQGLEMAAVGWNASGTYQNGGAWSRSSETTHREYSATFSGDYGDVQDVLDFVEGQFGPGPYYFVDPFSQGTNMLPKWIASPRLMASDAPSFLKGVRPTLVDTPANSLRLPTKSAVFTTTALSAFTPFRLAIPDNGSVTLLWWGSSTGTATLRANNLVVPPGVETTVTGPWLDLSLSGIGTITISGIMCQYGTTNFTKFLSGRGATALDKTSTQLTGYSAIRGRVSATLGLLEVGGWK